jgi:tetratricopeptide (TPR) repeat protein
MRLALLAGAAAVFGLLSETTPAQDSQQKSDIKGDNNVVVQIIGNKTPNELREISINLDKLSKLSSDSGIAVAVLQRFFIDINESNVPQASWPAKLAEIATRYNDLRAQLTERQSSSAASTRLRNEARVQLDAGKFDLAENLLGQSKHANLAAVARLESEKNLMLGEAASDAAAQGSAARLRYDYPTAARLFSEALDLSKRSGDRSKQVRYAFKAAQNFYDTDEFKRAKPLATEAVALRKEVSDPEISECDTLKVLAWTESALDDLSAGLRAFQTCLTQLEGRPIDHIRELDNYAFFLKRNQMAEQARDAQLRALEIPKTVPDIDVETHGRLLCNLGETYLQLKKYELAREALTQAMRLEQKPSEIIGNHRWICQHNLGTAYGYLKQYEEAETVLRSALSTAEIYFGENSRSVAGTFWQLGWIDENRLKYDSALEYYRRAVANWESPPPDRRLAEMGRKKIASITSGPMGLIIRPDRGSITKQSGTQTLSGLKVLYVAAGSPADRAGLVQGDLVVALDRKAVTGDEDLQKYVGEKRQGARITLQVARGNDLLELVVMKP